MALFACTTKLGPGAYSGRHTGARPSAMQWLLAVRETVVIKPSRLNIVVQSLPIPSPILSLALTLTSLSLSRVGSDQAVGWWSPL